MLWSAVMLWSMVMLIMQSHKDLVQSIAPPHSSERNQEKSDARVYGNADYAIAQGFGSKYRSTTFFRTKSGEIGVKCGCFYGNLSEFRKKVVETHGKTKKAKEYLMLADLMEYRFADSDNK